MGLEHDVVKGVKRLKQARERAVNGCSERGRVSFYDDTTTR